MKNKKIVSLILGLTMLSNISFAASTLTDEELAQKFLENVKFIKSKYYGQLTNEQILDYATKGVAGNLDPYSDFFNKEEAADLMSNITGNYVGIGISIAEGDGYIEITKVFANSPAEEAGLEEGDKIVQINNYPLDGLTPEQATDLIRGEEGTKVTLEVVGRGGKQAAKVITRREIKLSTVETKVIKDIGILSIYQFNEGTSKNVTTALKDFDNLGIKKIVIDLRDNPGGLLNEVVDIANNFVPKGPIMYMNFKDGTTETYRSQLEQTKYKVAVLVNGNSASASEILTGSIKDTKVGTVIGTTTYGKGCVQELYQLEDGKLMKITVAEYTTASKKQINEVGIEPDIYLEGLSYLKADKKYSIASKNTEVKNAEQILSTLGYNVGTVDENFDENTKQAVAKYQKAKGVYAYGVLDLTTQKLLNTDVKNTDVQLNKAIEVLNK